MSNIIQEQQQQETPIAAGYISMVPAAAFPNKKVPTMVVVDPMSRKLLIPVTAIYETRAQQRIGVPSLCMLFQTDRCRQLSACHQVHADPKVVADLRAIALSTNSCCFAHGDEMPHGFDWEKSWNDRTIVLAGVNHFFSMRNTAFTIGLQRLLKESGAATGRTSPISVPANMICRSHSADRCRFAEDCRFLHVCKEVLQSDPSLYAMACQNDYSNTPVTASLVRRAQFQAPPQLPISSPTYGPNAGSPSKYAGTPPMPELEARNKRLKPGVPVVQMQQQMPQEQLQAPQQSGTVVTGFAEQQHYQGQLVFVQQNLPPPPPPAQLQQQSPQLFQLQQKQRSPQQLQLQLQQPSPQQLQLQLQQRSPQQLQLQLQQPSPQQLQLQLQQRSPQQLQLQQQQQSPQQLQLQLQQQSPQLLQLQQQQSQYAGNSTMGGPHTPAFDPLQAATANQKLFQEIQVQHVQTQQVQTQWITQQAPDGSTVLYAPVVVVGEELYCEQLRQ